MNMTCFNTSINKTTAKVAVSSTINNFILIISNYFLLYHVTYKCDSLIKEIFSIKFIRL